MISRDLPAQVQAHKAAKALLRAEEALLAAHGAACRQV